MKPVSYDSSSEGHGMQLASDGIRMPRTVVLDTLDVRQTFVVGEGESLTLVLFLGWTKKTDGDVSVVLRGHNARVHILGIIFGEDVQQFRLHTSQLHERGGSISDLLIKSVLFDRARLHYEGSIVIERGADTSNAYQKNQTLLFSPDAWVDTRPVLEIHANDVRCTHGATVGNIDQEQLYYLMTRGVRRTDAIRLILEGFFSDVLAGISDSPIRDRLLSLISERFLRRRV